VDNFGVVKNSMDNCRRTDCYSSSEEQELVRLRKENKQLQMENDILKKAALILGRK